MPRVMSLGAKRRRSNRKRKSRNQHPGFQSTQVRLNESRAWSAEENRLFAARHMKPLFANDKIFSQTREHSLVVIQPGHGKILFRNRERTDRKKQPNGDQNDVV